MLTAAIDGLVARYGLEAAPRRGDGRRGARVAGARHLAGVGRSDLLQAAPRSRCAARCDRPHPAQRHGLLARRRASLRGDWRTTVASSTTRDPAPASSPSARRAAKGSRRYWRGSGGLTNGPHIWGWSVFEKPQYVASAARSGLPGSRPPPGLVRPH